MALLFNPATVLAEPVAGPAMDGLTSPGRERLPLPDYRTLPPAETEQSPAAAPSPAAPLPAQARFLVRHIEITGNTVFSAAELAPLTAAYEEREVSVEELQALRRQLTLYYVERGYVNSGAMIPKQEVGPDGVVTIQIIEGRLTGLSISGPHRLRDDYIRSRLELGVADGPLNMKRLGQNVLALHDGPVLRRIKARLRPGDKPGEGVLLAEVEEKDPWRLVLQVANDRSPSVGSERVEADIAHLNLTGWGDTLEVNGSLTEGSGDLETSYSRPLNAVDTTLRLWFTRSDAEVVEEPFKELAVSSMTETFGLSLRHPTLKTLDTEWATEFILERRHGETFLRNDPFALFFDAEQGGAVTLTAFRLAENVIIRQPARVMACRQLFTIGVDALGATASEQGKSNFLISLTQAQWAERLGSQGVQVLAKADLQLSREPLLYMEKFAVGGESTVRGYRENLLLRDNGVTASLELRVPVGRLPLLAVSRETDDGLVQVAPFVDWGRSWDCHDPAAFMATEVKYLASLGLGLRWEPSATIHAQIYAALALNNDGFEQVEHSLQDAGIHFRLVYQAR